MKKFFIFILKAIFVGLIAFICVKNITITHKNETDCLCRNKPLEIYVR